MQALLAGMEIIHCLWVLIALMEQLLQLVAVVVQLPQIMGEPEVLAVALDMAIRGQEDQQLRQYLLLIQIQCKDLKVVM
jgi:hypothetical protein